MTAKRSSPTFAEVAPAVPLAGSRTTYTYQVPQTGTVAARSAVTIPFGPRRVTGIVVEIHRRRPRYALKSIVATTSTQLTENQFQFAHHLARVMRGGLGFTLRLFLPPSRRSTPPPAQGAPRRAPKERTPEIKHYLERVKKSDAAFIQSDFSKRRDSLLRLISVFTHQTKKSALILIPEKALLRHYTGLPVVTADLKPRELASIWHGVSTGAIPAVIGTQKALFLPFQKLGLVVVEEEAWPTHKLWDQYPRLSNIDGAQMLARLHHAHILWSGSFPSVRLHAAHQTGVLPALDWNPIALRPELHIATSADRAKQSLVPVSLIDTVRRFLARREPTLVLYNRRDERVRQLRHLFHRAFGKLFSQVTFASTAVFSDATPGQFAHAAWLFPESPFTYPDFRSEEQGLIILSRLHQLIPPGEAVHITTRSLTLAQRLLQWSPTDWYDTILRERRAMSYPPFADAIKLTITEKSSARARRRAEHLRHTLDDRRSKHAHPVRILGPFSSLAARTGESPASEQHLLLLGDAATLPDLYQDLKIDSVDLSPHRLL